MGVGVPSGLNWNSSTWKEHFGSSSLPPEHHSRSFHVWASLAIVLVMLSVVAWSCGWKSLHVPVQSSTKPTMVMWAECCPSTLTNFAPLLIC